MANGLKIGYGKTNITPPLGIFVSGYGIKRYAKGVLDELEAIAVVVEKDGKRVVLVAFDNIGIDERDINDSYKKEASIAGGVPEDGVFIHATHIHTGPEIGGQNDELIREHVIQVRRKIKDAVILAVQDLKECEMGVGEARAERVAFIRRYRMKDGTVRTNPGVNNPDILAPIGDIDDMVGVVRFKRKSDDIVLVNFANHPDTIGGEYISGDWPAQARRVVEKAIDNCKCVVFNGAEGDVNHVNVHPVSGDFNDMFNDFDDCSRGYGHSLHVGRVIAGAVLKVFDKVEFVEVDKVACAQKEYGIKSNKPLPEEMELARLYYTLHKEGKDDQIPYTGMMLTTVVSDANRKIRLENAPDEFDLLFSAVKIGPVGFFGIPGEPFNAIGKGVKDASGYKIIFPCCIVNAYDGYFPMKDSYDEGGYEARCSNFKAGVGEKMIEIGKEMLENLNN